MKEKILLPASVKWRRGRANKKTGWSAFGKPVLGLATIRMTVFIRDMKCQYPGCTRNIDYFKVDDKGGLSAMSYNQGKPMSMTIDHKIARCLGGKDDNSNMWVMCKHHNHYKSRLEHTLLDIMDRKMGSHNRIVQGMGMPLEEGGVDYEQPGEDSDSTGYS